MSIPARAGRALVDLGRLSRAGRVLTPVIAVAPLLVWTCSLLAGAAFSLWTLLVVVVLTLLTVLEPDSHAGLSTVLFLGWYWFSHVFTHAGDPVSPWALGAALCLLAFHSATAARATAPGTADLDQAFWRRWLSRVAIIAVGTGCVWGLTAVLASRQPAPEGLILAAFAALVGGTTYARWAVVRDR